jgi:hypothetical protein
MIIEFGITNLEKNAEENFVFGVFLFPKYQITFPLFLFLQMHQFSSQAPVKHCQAQLQ